jgi:8-oxo-dGTP pyrophosphatase MutT (NUDIX family)
MMERPVPFAIDRLELGIAPYAWPFAQTHRTDIDDHFDTLRRSKPELWNGRVLLMRDAAIGDGMVRGTFFETGFADFMAWRDWGFPDRAVRNCFSMGALRGSDGGYLLGVMSAFTANAGRIYFPAGTPDLDDVKLGAVDIAGSIAREIEEETGLTPSDYRAGTHWDCVVSGAAIAMMRILDVDSSGEALRARIEADLARQPQPELAAMHLVRTTADFTAAMPRYVTAFMERQFSA